MAKPGAELENAQHPGWRREIWCDPVVSHLVVAVNVRVTFVPPLLAIFVDHGE
jgi:hypothetical protein